MEAVLGSEPLPEPAHDGLPYTPIRLRPFWRRLLSTSRPALVRMRTRKPWVLFRRRLFGWNVRFISLVSLPRAARRAPEWKARLRAKP